MLTFGKLPDVLETPILNRLGNHMLYGPGLSNPLISQASAIHIAV